MHSFAFIAVSSALILAVSVASNQDIPHNDFFTQTRTCIPGQQFVDKCNVCFCFPDGKVAACTRAGCFEQVPKPHIDGFSSSGALACLPDTHFFDGCNSCTCSKSGTTAVCTLAAECNVHARSRRSASPKVVRIDNFEQSRTCTPGQQFYNQCNTCICNADGKNAACTLKGCVNFGELRIDNFAESRRCPAGQTFKQECNTCKCNADGTNAACTLMGCLP